MENGPNPQPGQVAEAGKSNKDQKGRLGGGNESRIALPVATTSEGKENQHKEPVDDDTLVVWFSCLEKGSEGFNFNLQYGE